MKKVLNVGGGSKAIPIPPYYSGWEHHLLDIDDRGKPDVVMDARNLQQLPGGTYDAVYCSHNLEHYSRPDGTKVLAGFLHVLNETGFAEVRVPDILATMLQAVKAGLDVDDVLYQSQAGPVLVRDVFYGHHVEVDLAGNDFYIHKTGFSPRSLSRFVQSVGFYSSAVGSHNPLEITAYLFKRAPSAELLKSLGINASPAGAAGK